MLLWTDEEMVKRMGGDIFRMMELDIQSLILALFLLVSKYSQTWKDQEFLKNWGFFTARKNMHVKSNNDPWLLWKFQMVVS